MIRGTIILLHLWVISCTLQAQNPTVSIATWKNNAKGAYNIIHDDFGDYVVIGIQNYADTMHMNRGLKFTFGAITVSCEGNPGMYDKAKSMISYGHEIINHSHNHRCAIYKENDCTDGSYWAEPATQDFDTEMKYSTNSIFNNTGVYPRYFIYPYDKFNEDANDYLKSIGYIGSRTGDYDSYDSDDFTPDAEGFFRSAVVVDVETTAGVTKAARLNNWVDTAIAKNVWINRELHNVGTTGWGHVTPSEYRTHLNYIKKKVNSGDLWMGTISEILTYQIQKLNYKPASSVDASGNITVSWNTPAFNVKNYLNPLVYKSSITLNVDISNHPGNYQVSQGGKKISEVKIKGNIISINVYPHNGPVLLQKVNCAGVCIQSQPDSKIITAGQSFSLSVIASAQSGTLTYQWYKNGNILSGATSSIYSISSAQTSHAGEYYVVVSNGTTSVTSSKAIVTITNQNPYGGTPISIPGKLEAENFDLGGQGNAFNETTSNDEGDAGYRSEPVDIEKVNDDGYSVGYITDGEWLEYTVNVTTAGIYDFEFRVASESTGNGVIKVELDGAAILPSFTLPITGGWSTWQTATASDVNIPSAGTHILRLYFTKGDFNLDYVQVINRSPLSIDDRDPSVDHSRHIDIYPNPSAKVLYINALNSAELLSFEDEIEISDITGKLMHRVRVIQQENKIDVSSLPKGVYQIRIPYNNTFVYKKFLKEE